MASELILIVRWQYVYIVCGVPGGPTSERCHPGCDLGCEEVCLCYVLELCIQVTAVEYSCIDHGV